MKKKSIALFLAFALVAGVAIGGTLAWLTAGTESVVNTFTTSDIEVTLTETDRTYQMVPGHTIEKDPKVKVSANSEDCYLFIKVVESDNLDSYITYEIDSSNWTTLPNVEGVYYMEISDTSEKDVFYTILGDGSATFENVAYNWTDNNVLVKPTVTKTMMNALDSKPESKPTLTFTAYAVQLYKNNTEKFSAEEAWELTITD